MGSISPPTTIRVAVTNHEPAWLDLQAGVAKTISLIAEAGDAGCKLIAFPETWLIGYPCWIWTRPVDFQLAVKYVQNSLIVDSPEMKSICAAAKEHDIAVCLGKASLYHESQSLRSQERVQIVSRIAAVSVALQLHRNPPVVLFAKRNFHLFWLKAANFFQRFQ